MRSTLLGGFTALAGPAARYAAFPAVADPAAEFSVFASTGQSKRLVPDVGVSVSNGWTLTCEGNTAYGFWLRRRADGAHAEWLAAHGG